jgi:hypothetical protein
MKAVYALIAFFAFTTDSSTDGLEEVRRNYAKAVEDKELCRQMIEQFEKKTENAIEQAYLGGFQAIWAKHAVNPLKKLASFNNGRQAIEAAVEKEPFNVEIRCIRLSVQNNAPSILGYTGNIEEDRDFINANRAKITSPALQRMADKLIHD